MKKLFPWLKRYWCPRCFNRFYVFKRELQGISFRKASQNLPLEPVYLVCWFHAIPIREAHGFKDNTFIYLVTGINKDGHKDILSLCISNSSNDVFWPQVFENLKARGLKDISITISDLSEGLRKGLSDFFPKAIHLQSFTRQIRLSTQYISAEQSHEFFKDLHTVFEADDVATAHKYFDIFSGKWSNLYGYSVKRWENNWPELSRYLIFSNEIRSILLSDHILDHMDSGLEKLKQLKKNKPDQKKTLRYIEKIVTDIQKKPFLIPFNRVKILDQFKLFFSDQRTLS